MLLHFVHIPADPASPLVTRSVHIETRTLSCDAAYFVPLLLREAVPGFSSPNSVVVYPTFNECLKDNVPLLLYKKTEPPRAKQENSRAKQLVQLFSDKLARKQATFPGDVLVFWRKSFVSVCVVAVHHAFVKCAAYDVSGRHVNERGHKMKLADFTTEEACRLLGLSASCAVPQSGAAADGVSEQRVTCSATEKKGQAVVEPLVEDEELRCPVITVHFPCSKSPVQPLCLSVCLS